MRCQRRLAHDYISRAGPPGVVDHFVRALKRARSIARGVRCFSRESIPLHTTHFIYLMTFGIDVIMKIEQVVRVDLPRDRFALLNVNAALFHTAGPLQ